MGAMPNMLSLGPLSDAEIDELERFLLEADDIDDSMDISMLDGFLTAILCGRRTIMPSEWMPWVWDAENGEEEPAFKTKAQGERILGMILRHMNDIARTLNEAPEEYEPLIFESPNGGDPVPVIDEWCVGFVKGMALDEEGWASLPSGKRAGIAEIMLYGTEAGWDKLKEMSLPLDRHREIADGLASTVRNVHAYFLEQRRRK